jgi:tRNA(fMet)-specific endonuclease VapC
VNGNALLDTTIVVAHFRRDAALTARLQQTKTLYLPLTALGELFFGAYRSQNPAKALAQVREFLKAVVLLQPGETTADWYGRIKAELAQAGTPIPQNDLWIAALAREYDLPLAARDDHFKHVRGLSLLDW